MPSLLACDGQSPAASSSLALLTPCHLLPVTAIPTPPWLECLVWSTLLQAILGQTPRCVQLKLACAHAFIVVALCLQLIKQTDCVHAAAPITRQLTSSGRRTSFVRPLLFALVHPHVILKPTTTLWKQRSVSPDSTDWQRTLPADCSLMVVFCESSKTHGVNPGPQPHAAHQPFRSPHCETREVNAELQWFSLSCSQPLTGAWACTAASHEGIWNAVCGPLQGDHVSG